MGVLGRGCSQPLSGGAAGTGWLGVSSGGRLVAQGNRAGGRVPLNPRGQRLVHSDGVCLHLALEAVHLLPGDTRGKGRRLVRRHRFPKVDMSLTSFDWVAVRSHISGAFRDQKNLPIGTSYTDGSQNRRDSRCCSQRHAEANRP